MRLETAPRQIGPRRSVTQSTSRDLYTYSGLVETPWSALDLSSELGFKACKHAKETIDFRRTLPSGVPQKSSKYRYKIKSGALKES